MRLRKIETLKMSGYILSVLGKFILLANKTVEKWYSHALPVIGKKLSLSASSLKMVFLSMPLTII